MQNPLQEDQRAAYQRASKEWKGNKTQWKTWKSQTEKLLFLRYFVVVIRLHICLRSRNVILGEGAKIPMPSKAQLLAKSSQMGNIIFCNKIFYQIFLQQNVQIKFVQIFLQKKILQILQILTCVRWSWYI